MTRQRYDLVHSLTVNTHHAASYQYQPYPPTPTEALTDGRIFKLPRSKVENAARDVINAVQQWQAVAGAVGVSAEDIEKVARVMKI